MKPPETAIGLKPSLRWQSSDDWRPSIWGYWDAKSILTASICLSVSIPSGLSTTTLSSILRLNSGTHGFSDSCTKLYTSLHKSCTKCNYKHITLTLFCWRGAVTSLLLFMLLLVLLLTSSSDVGCWLFNITSLKQLFKIICNDTFYTFISLIWCAFILSSDSLSLFISYG